MVRLIKNWLGRLVYLASPHWVEMRGGLGNQLFQACFAIHLMNKNKKVLLDTAYYTNLTPGDTPRKLEPIIAAHFKTAPMSKFIKKALRTLDLVTLEHGLEFGSRYLEAHKKTLYFSGYWQSFHYTDPVKKQLIELLKIEPSHPKMAIHIRRGDYVTNKNAAQFHGVLDLNYYYKAIDLIASQRSISEIEIYSDDPEWAKQNFNRPGFVIKVMPSTDPFADLQKMAKCSYFVIANSTYSWWAAYLSRAPDKIVIAPQKWFSDINIDTKDLVPNEWIRL